MIINARIKPSAKSSDSAVDIWETTDIHYNISYFQDTISDLNQEHSVMKASGQQHYYDTPAASYFVRNTNSKKVRTGQSMCVRGAPNLCKGRTYDSGNFTNGDDSLTTIYIKVYRRYDDSIYIHQGNQQFGS